MSGVGMSGVDMSGVVSSNEWCGDKWRRDEGCGDEWCGDEWCSDEWCGDVSVGATWRKSWLKTNPHNVWNVINISKLFPLSSSWNTAGLLNRNIITTLIIT